MAVARIISGEAGSLALDVPSGPTRPTSERVREAMFSALAHRMDFQNARVLDLYAGSGLLGCEALSRGASRLVAVDSDRRACRALQTNTTRVRGALSHPVDIELRCQSVHQALNQMGADERFDLVFLDPPYDLADQELVTELEALSAHVEQGGLVVVERSSKSPLSSWPSEFVALSEKSYGDTWVLTLSR